MADFPSKVNTETSSPQHEAGNRFQRMAASVYAMSNMTFIRSIPAILMMVEIFLGMLHWALIASGPYMKAPVYGWVMSVAVTLWILTTILFFLILFGDLQQIPVVPWPMTVMLYHCTATVLYLTAFLANAASVTPFHVFGFYNHMAAAAFFGAVVTLAYGTSAFFSYLEWRGDGGNAASSTVPT